MSRLLQTIAPSRLGTGFRALLASAWVSNIGDGIALAAGPLLVASHTDDPRLIALAALLLWAPGFLFGLYAGALADRLDRRLVVVVGDLVRTAVLVILVTMVATDTVTIWVVLVTLFVLGTVETLVDSSAVTLLPMIVAKPDLGVANARMQFGWMGLNRLVGPPLGAGLFALGAAWPFLAQALCCAAGALLLLRVVLPGQGAGEAVEDGGAGEAVEDGGAGGAARTHVLRDIREGFAWAWRHPAMRALNLQILTFNVTYGASWAVLVLYARERLGLDDVGYGLLLAATAVGGVLGAATYGWLERHVPLRSIMRYGLVLETLTHAVLAWTTLPLVAGGILLLFGVHESYWGATASSVRQRAVPTELQGRVASVYMMCMMGGLVVGSALGGLLADRGGITAPYWFGFVGSGLILVAIWRQLGRIAHADELARGL